MAIKSLRPVPLYAWNCAYNWPTAGGPTVLRDLNLAGTFADRVMVMSDGKMVTTGAPDDALRPELLSAVFHQEVLVMPHPQTNRPVVLAAYEDDGGGKTGGRLGV